MKYVKITWSGTPAEVITVELLSDIPDEARRCWATVVIKFGIMRWSSGYQIKTTYYDISILNHYQDLFSYLPSRNKFKECVLQLQLHEGDVAHALEIARL